MIDTEKRDFGKWWIWILVLFIVSIVALGLTRAGGLVFWTAVEREVFEQSYQRSAAQEARFNTLNAELIQAETLLRSNTLTETQEADARAQIAGIRAQLNAMEK